MNKNQIFTITLFICSMLFIYWSRFKGLIGVVIGMLAVIHLIYTKNQIFWLIVASDDPLRNKFINDTFGVKNEKENKTNKHEK